MPKANKRKFKSWEGVYPEDDHIRLTVDMLKHKKYRKLSSSAKVLYIYMKQWANCGFNDEVTYSAKMAEYIGMTKPTYYRARDELITEGFICWVNKPVSSCLRNEAAQFEFVNTWHTGKQRDPP